MHSRIHTLNTSIILLAAGASTRLARPKQLLEIQGELLIHKMIQTCLASEANQTVVVLGAFREAILAKIEAFDVHTTFNEDWETGMLGSIQTGLQAVLQQNPDTEAVLVLLCDQYFVSSPLINNFIHTYQQHKEKKAFCATYENTIGVPALFDKALFPDLLAMKASSGAKKLLLSLQRQQQLIVLPFPKGKYDIDTEEQLADLKKLLE